MSSLSHDQQRFVEAAKRVYEEKLKDQLERDHFGKLIAVEPESADYVLAATFSELDQACRERFGQKPVHMFRVGGAGRSRLEAVIVDGYLDELDQAFLTIDIGQDR